MVSWPTMPSGAMPLAFWKSATAAWVFSPKVPVMKLLLKYPSS